MLFYRMLRSRLTYVFIGVSLIIAALGFFATLLEGQILVEFMGAPGALDDVTYNGFTKITEILAVNFHTICVSAFILLFIAVDYSTGYVKNIVGYRVNKFNCCMANTLIVCVYAAIIFVINIAFGLGFTAIFYKVAEWKGLGKFLMYLLVNFIDTVAFTQLLLFLSDVIKKNVPVMIIGLIYAMMSSLVYLLVDLLVQWAGVEDFLTQRYTILGAALELNVLSEWGDFARMGAIGLGALILFFILDCIVMKKREVN